MSDNIMQDIATQLQEIDNAIYEAKDLISALKEVGEDVTDKEAELRNLEKRKVKWAEMLKKRGY